MYIWSCATIFARIILRIHWVWKLVCGLGFEEELFNSIVMRRNKVV